MQLKINSDLIGFQHLLAFGDYAQLANAYIIATDILADQYSQRQVIKLIFG